VEGREEMAENKDYTLTLQFTMWQVFRKYCMNKGE
jgi:hypothetical protein